MGRATLEDIAKDLDLVGDEDGARIVRRGIVEIKHLEDGERTVRRGIAEIERLRAALRAVLVEINLGGGEFEEPDIDKIRDLAWEALGDE